MKKNVWIINHYAGGMLFKNGGRHYWFSKYLKKDGYEPVVFCCNAKHGKEEFFIETDRLWVEKKAENIDVPFVFVKSTTYSNNGKARIMNMIRFYSNVRKAMKEYAKIHGKPDVILASSVHPLSLVAGIKLAKYFGIKCICEVRDLWPLSLVAFDIIDEKSALCKLLYQGEKWIYTHADQLVFTFKNGAQYIKDRGWDKSIDLKKVHYINNGIDLDGYDNKRSDYAFHDKDLESEKVKIIYTGSMGPPNQINLIIDAAKKLQDSSVGNVMFILFGDGISRNAEEQRCISSGIDNVIFKGTVEKEKIPYILSKSDATVLIEKNTPLNRYGISENKVFDYLAAGKPILCNDASIRSIVDESDCAIVDNDLANAVRVLLQMDPEDYRKACSSSEIVAHAYDFESLTDTLESIIEMA